jgi:Cytochrome c7 and related cytochrome c
MKKLTLAIFVLATLAIATVAFTQSFGVQLGGRKGPKQPIAYSHKIHAGKLGMNCRYCHYGAYKSAWANIPAMSTCMGCHKMAVADRPEIQKLADYFERGENIPWVKVHYLPDHVKFNHKRHLAAGFPCQQCHGPVQEMDVVYQYSSLKMGWCVDCHRKYLNDPKHPATLDCVACHH